ncbi:two-component system OmpR family response regulator [Variovorax boronicumulans]|uniref:response regulator transcription factor n=1 Tax=Variovorax boronicumulans TaxID=436515 RepID=UPI00159E75AE|nr:response regulator transcription factor [Variovorax boronicumulans]MDQ0012215.1 two-component system OmpR family response regulator [Variovorax boronicumulans]
MNAQARVLVIEDDDDLRDTLLRYLRGVGMLARGLESAEGLDAELLRQDFDAVVCDVNLPGEDGFSVLVRLRSRSAMRIVMLTARGMANDRLHGLGLGADYYLVKPVNLRELEMVLHNLLRRSHETHGQGQGMREPAAHAADEPAAQVPWRYQGATWLLLSPAGQRVQLSNAEARLLQCLIERPREVVDRATLLAAMGRPGLEAYERNLDVTVSRLRRKAEQASGEKLPIVAVRGEGYSFQGSVRIER